MRNDRTPNQCNEYHPNPLLRRIRCILHTAHKGPHWNPDGRVEWKAERGEHR